MTGEGRVERQSRTEESENEVCVDVSKVYLFVWCVYLLVSVFR